MKPPTGESERKVNRVGRRECAPLAVADAGRALPAGRGSRRVQEPSSSASTRVRSRGWVRRSRAAAGAARARRSTSSFGANEPVRRLGRPVADLLGAAVRDVARGGQPGARARSGARSPPAPRARAPSSASSPRFSLPLGCDQSSYSAGGPGRSRCLVAVRASGATARSPRPGRCRPRHRRALAHGGRHRRGPLPGPAGTRTGPPPPRAAGRRGARPGRTPWPGRCAGCGPRRPRRRRPPRRRGGGRGPGPPRQPSDRVAPRACRTSWAYRCSRSSSRTWCQGASCGCAAGVRWRGRGPGPPRCTGARPRRQAAARPPRPSRRSLGALRPGRRRTRRPGRRPRVERDLGGEDGDGVGDRVEAGGAERLEGRGVGAGPGEGELPLQQGARPARRRRSSAAAGAAGWPAAAAVDARSRTAAAGTGRPAVRRPLAVPGQRASSRPTAGAARRAAGRAGGRQACSWASVPDSQASSVRSSSAQAGSRAGGRCAACR